ncbi:MAG: acyl-CoA dehydrogenase, partial [Caulobacteraceae bacterium]|nr:acyl-CoA dehydrogenase [Caulobacteraceae bacterium]
MADEAVVQEVGAEGEIIRSIARIMPDRAAARRAADGGPALDRELWRRLAELGVFAVGLPESHGGVGLGLSEAAAIAEALAARAAPVPALSAFLAGAILAGDDGEAARRWGERLASGEMVLGTGLSAATGASSDIIAHEAGEGRARLTGRIRDALDGAALDALLVWADGRWWALSADAPGLSRTELASFDPTRRLAAIELADVEAEAVSTLPPEAVMRIAWTLSAAESIGAGQAALDMAREYALVRRQFGQPIGRFQAIKHKLTDCLAAIETARSALLGAAGAGAELDERSARMAKSVATAAGVFAVAEAVQVHGAIGNTWEHDLHLLLRRAKHCQLSLGSPDAHAEALAEDLLAAAAEGGRSHAGGGRASLDAVIGLDPAVRAFADELNAWLDANLDKDRLGAMHRGGAAERRQARRDWQARLADGGWAGIHWPGAFGGRDASFTQQVVYHATLAGRGLPALIGNRGLSLVGPTLIAHGSPEQKARFVEATRRADILWASGLSERGSGSDLASLSTRGVVDGESLVITGHKIWTTSAHFSDWLFALIRTGPAKPKHAGISCVLIPLDSPGLTIRPIKRMNGD